jgi:DNA-binding MarR family transcriptional regulator
MAGRLPLSTLLSHVLIAFTIELDNEFERQMPHRTSTGSVGGRHHGPWLVSWAMWSNFMRFVDEKGVPLRELQGVARMTNLAGLERWGYIVVEPDPSDLRPKPPRRDWLVRPTLQGRRAQEVWRPLAGVIEQRWRTRFGEDEIGALRASLQALVGQFDVELPHYLPVVSHAMFAAVPHVERMVTAGIRDDIVPHLDLPALLSQALLAFTIDFEREPHLSLPMSANIIRVLGERGVLLRDLPRLSGVSKEAISMSGNFLKQRGYVEVEHESTSSRAKLARLTPKGLEARDADRQLLGIIEERWQLRFGENTLCTLRVSLEQLVREPTAGLSPLFGGLEPYPDGWRASVRKPDTLPHYPMVLHRGGFPDGS